VPEKKWINPKAAETLGSKGFEKFWLDIWPPKKCLFFPNMLGES
jgi:hypothetical protein